jgi:Spy/CpxP family protein refolding chaperone
MKARMILTASTLLMFVFGLVLNAQPAPASGNSNKPGLTDEQKTKMKEMRVAHYKEISPLKNKMGELKARKHSLETAEKADLAAINAVIDEIGKLQIQIEKSNAANRLQIRGLLTDEQRMVFDNPNLKKKLEKEMRKAGKQEKHKKGQKHQGEKLNEEAPSAPSSL